MIKKLLSFFGQKPARAQTVVLREERLEDNGRLLEASLTSGGDLVIHGVDWGSEVERFWGSREYEWNWTVKAPELSKLDRALQAEGNVLAALSRQFSDDKAAGLGDFLEKHAIEYETWSRVGD